MQISVYNFYISIFQLLFNNGNNVKLYYSIIFLHFFFMVENLCFYKASMHSHELWYECCF